MNTKTIWLPALLVTAGLCAQETGNKMPAQDAMPNPKTEQHAALEQWVGNWKLTGNMDAMPGVPGMEKPLESEGTEAGSLICDGLWLKWESEVTAGGKRSTGLWLVGYDALQKQYISYVVSSDESCQGLTTLTGQYDESADTWTWVGETPEGKMKSVCKFSGPDSVTETLYMVGPDGKDKQFMVMNRVRATGAEPPSLMNASLKKDAEMPTAKHTAVLLQDVGTWDATVESSFGGQETKEKGSDRVSAICDGRWTWSEFHSQFMGKPFDGHALVGWDPNQEKYVSLWIDSMTATGSITTGTFDEETKTFTLAGTGPGPDGKPMKIEETLSYEDKDTRVLQMNFDHPQMKSTMKVTYSRRADK